MAQYIDKDAVIAWAKETYLCENASMIRKVCFKQLVEHLDTLEVKEVDLEKEFSQWWKCERAKDYNVDILYERYPNVSMKLARHFFELGLKAQKGE